jgi:hypothetical protein
MMEAAIWPLAMAAPTAWHAIMTQLQHWTTEAATSQHVLGVRTTWRATLHREHPSMMVHAFTKMNVESVEVLGISISVDAQTSPKATVIATETKLTLSGFAEDCVNLIPTTTAFVTHWKGAISQARAITKRAPLSMMAVAFSQIVQVNVEETLNWMTVGCVMVTVRSTHAGVPTFLKATVTVMETKSMPSVNAEERVKLTSMEMVSAILMNR